MKNFILFFLLIAIFYSVRAQNRKFSIETIDNLIQDTTSIIESDKYYLVNISGYEELKVSASKVVNDELIVIKGELINPVNVNENFYLLNSSWKFSQNFYRKIGDNEMPHIFSVHYRKPFDIAKLKEYPQLEVIKEIGQANMLIIKTSLSTIKSVSNLPEIEHIDLYERKAVEESPLRQYNPSINRVTTAQNNYPDLKGNITISLKENSVEETDIDLLSKVTIDENSSGEFTQHAKEMATFIAGYGNSFMTGKGVATGAQIICTNFSSLFPEEQSYYTKHSILAQNHSYGTGIENFYGNETLSYDQAAIDMPELTFVFSAGNAGSTAPEFGTYQGIDGYANLTGDFKQAKNVLVIAALDSTMNHESLTSSGPTYDGRIKPELAVYGGEGSSESAAIASGSVAMIQDYFYQLNDSYPTSSLVKSLLIAGANEADTPGIDFRTGYGSLNLNRSLSIIDSASFYEATIHSDEILTKTISVPSQTSEIKVVVSWIDPSANPEDATALVNDLDLKVKSPSNTTWLPWVLDASPDSNSLSSLPTRNEDHLNNVELVSIENPDAGDYTVSIKANTLATASQGLSVAYLIRPKDKFEWSFPTKSDHLIAGTNPFFRWENTYDSQTSSIYISYGGSGWQSIGNTDVTDEQFMYALKDTTTYAQLKMEIGAATYYSDTFSISRLVEIEVENDCSDNLTFSWNKLNNTDSYTLYGLQNTLMTPLFTTTDTLIKLNKADFPQTFFAIQPNQSTHFEGLRSYAINYANQNKGCYLTNFLATLNVNNFVTIELSINVPYEIDEITIFKTFENKTTTLELFTPGNSTYFNILDYDLEPGQQTYKAELKLLDGSVISSQEISLFYTDENTVSAFPNPTNNNFINILNAYPGGSVQLIGSSGKILQSFDLINTVEPIDLTGIEPGVYVYKVLFDNKIVAGGRFIKL
ncbi:MAG: S8 family peptidase [Cyclobacteriaceae bacterium]|nr:S8 family peptidase [Cyclobacteriaceae bacterium]